MNGHPKLAGLNPRKTAKQLRAANTVKTIVEAAARILETLGFEGFTTNAIAERAGVSIGSLYQYYPNKYAITLALIARESMILLAEIQSAAALARWEEAMEQMVEAAVRHQLRRPALARLLDVEEARLPVGDETIPGSGAVYDAVRTVIAKIPPATASKVDRLAADVIGITRGMTDMAGKTGESDMDSLVRRVRRAVLGYLASGS